MGDLKPIGSEKLQGQEKIKRILEIARYKEVNPSNINESSSTEYSIKLADGVNYQIVKEKLGYIIKKTISESETDYIEPIKNRKYYSSYSQAFKRLNLMAKETNILHGNEEGVSLFGEQKKFVLKTPKSSEPVSDVPPANEPPVAPPPVPSPELPPSDIGGGDEAPVADDMGGDLGGDLGGESPEPETGAGDSVEGDTSFKMVQKLTGKITQKLRELEQGQGLTSEQIKYVINMILSSVELDNLNDEDREDILSKFESDEENQEGGEEMMGADDEMPVGDSEMGDEEMAVPEQPEGEMGESQSMGHIFDSIFSESKIDKVLSKYFEISDREKKQITISERIKKKKVSTLVERKMKSVRSLSESVEQELSSKKFLEENSNFNFIGKTNKKNLIFESGDKQVKITPSGLVK